MRKETPKSVSLTIVVAVVLSVLWLIWICPGIIAKIIITVAVIKSLLTELAEDLKE